MVKTLIIYGSKYGFTKKCMERLLEKLSGEVDLVEAKAIKNNDLSQYDKVIIGGSIYMGQIQKQVKAYCNNNLSELETKKVGLFLCCGSSESFELQLKNAFPQELLERAVVKENFGGILDMTKMNFFHKMITGMMTKAAIKEGKKLPEAYPENIDKLAAAMNLS